MKIYFAGSIRGGREEEGTYLKLIEHLGTYGQVLTEHVGKKGIDNHFIKRVNSREQLIRKVKIIPIEFVIRNFAFGSIIKRYNLSKEYKFKKPLIELFLKKDELNDPLINDDLIVELSSTIKSVSYTHLRAHET